MYAGSPLMCSSANWSLGPGLTEDGPWICKCRRQTSAAISQMENGTLWVSPAKMQYWQPRRKLLYYCAGLKSLGFSTLLFSMSIFWTLQHSPWFTESSRIRHTYTHTHTNNWKIQCFPWGTCSYGKVSASMGVCISLRSAPSLKSGGTAYCSWWEPVFNDLNRKTIIMFIIVLSLQCIGEGNGTPELLPGKSHGQRSLVGCSPWGR